MSLYCVQRCWIIIVANVFLMANEFKAEVPLSPGEPIQFYLPVNDRNYRGNTNTAYPIGVGPSVRYQQVFDTRLFKDIPTNGAFLSRIWFHSTAGGYIFGSNFTFRASTCNRSGF